MPMEKCANCSNVFSMSGVCQQVTDLAWHPEESGLLAVGSDDKSPNQLEFLSTFTTDIKGEICIICFCPQLQRPHQMPSHLGLKKRR